MSAFAARVRTGTTLAVAAAGLLWLNSFLPRGRLALVVVTVLAWLSAWELDRMGSFRGRRLALPLYASVVLCACILAVELRRPAGFSAPQALLVL